jgi:RimK family alpha-L-glutamate ligase
MRVAILSSGRGWHTADLERALEQRGHRAQILPIDAVVARIGHGPSLAIRGTSLGDCDAVLLRTIPRGSLEQIIFRIDTLHRLERMGVPVVNPARVVERTVDKFYTSALLEEAGLLTPPTIVAERFDDAMDAFRTMGDVIVKPLFGSNGRGIVRVSDEELAYRVFRALELERGVYYVQKVIPSWIGAGARDLRVFVLGERVLASVWRSTEGWRTNLSRGGRPERAELPAEWADLALAAARVVGAEYAGVDLIPTPHGKAYVVEVNGSPGWRGLGPTCRIDVAGAIVGHLESRVRASARA